MKKKIIGIFVCMLLIVTMLPITGTVIAGSEENPEIVDRTHDVKFLGFFRLIPQYFFKHVDIISAWFHEKSDNPDMLFVSIKMGNLNERTESLEAIYLVRWTHGNYTYEVQVTIHPEGVYGVPYVCIYYGHDDYSDFHECNCILDENKNIITWEVPKDVIGAPQAGDSLTHPFAFTNNRCTEESGMPRIDLFKDNTLNAKVLKDYIIQY